MKIYEWNDRMKVVIVINKYCVYKFIVISCCLLVNIIEDEIKKIGFFLIGLYRFFFVLYLFIFLLGKFCLGE